MSAGTSSSCLLATLTLLSVMNIGTQTTDRNTSQAIFSLHPMTSFELNLAEKQTKPNMSSRTPNLTQPSMKDLRQNTSGYSGDKQIEISKHGLCNTTETCHHHPVYATQPFGQDPDSSHETLRRDTDSSRDSSIDSSSDSSIDSSSDSSIDSSSDSSIDSSSDSSIDSSHETLRRDTDSSRDSSIDSSSDSSIDSSSDSSIDSSSDSSIDSSSDSSIYSSSDSSIDSSNETLRRDTDSSRDSSIDSSRDSSIDSSSDSSIDSSSDSSIDSSSDSSIDSSSDSSIDSSNETLRRDTDSSRDSSIDSSSDSSIDSSRDSSIDSSSDSSIDSSSDSSIDSSSDSSIDSSRDSSIDSSSDSSIDSSNETLRRDIDSSREAFHLGLDSSNEIFLSGLDSTAATFHHRLDSTMVTSGPDNSTTNFGHRSNNSTETGHYDAGRSTEMAEDGSDKPTEPFGCDSHVCTETQDASEVFLQMYTQFSSTSGDINDVGELLEHRDDVNITQGNSVFPYSCDQRCGYVIAASDDTVYPCQCDQACWLYGDCCSDYYSACLQQNINATSDRILHAVLGRLETFSQVLQLREDYLWSRISYCSPLESTKQYFQLVNMCSDDPQILVQFEDLHRDLTNPLSGSSGIFVGLSKKKIRQRCEHNIKRRTKHSVLDYTHVTLVQNTAIHFYNVFCAICNGINPSRLTAWEANVTCVNRTLNVMGTGLLVNDSISEAMMRNNCTITNAGFNTSTFRACFPKESLNTSDISKNDIQSICMSWNYTTWLLCQRYQNPYKETDTSTIYKNLHCLVCHLHAQAQILNSDKEYILSKEICAMKLIHECETEIYVCKSKSNNKCLIRQGNMKPVNSFVSAYDKVDDAIASLRIMYDFYSHQTTVTVNHTVRTIEMKACPQDQVYVPLYQSCRQAFCLPGTRWLHDQCVSVCSDDVTSKKESCGLDGNQKFDYKYLLCPHGCTSIRLYVALDYILWDDLSSVSIPNVNVMHFNTDDDENHDNNNDYVGSSISNSSSGDRDSSRGLSSSSSSRSEGDGSSSSSSSSSSNYSDIGNAAYLTTGVSATNTVVENITQSRNNITCSSPKDNMPFLFEISNLKSVWGKQMDKKINTTESRQKRYQKMVKLVLRGIHNTIVNHLDNTSQIDNFTVCRNYTCVTYSIDLAEIDNSQPKILPYNPCFDHSGSSNKRHYETDKRSGVCISFVVHLNSSKDFDTFVRSTKIMVRDIVRSAHETNFILSRMEITNMINMTNDIQREVTGARNNNVSNVKFATSSGDLCQNDEVLAYTETQLERYNNGTHVVNLNGTDINLVNLLFTMEIFRHLDISEKQVNLATVSWCQVELNKLNCGSFPLTLYEPENFVIYNRTLLITLMADKLTQFLYNNLFLEQDKREITDLMTLYTTKYGDNNWTIVQQGSYIQTRGGVLVCSNLSNMYLLEKYTLYNETKLKFMPDSEAEILATAIATGVSSFCLACTLAVYSLVSSLRNVPGKIVMSFSATLLCAQVLFLFCTKPKGLACEVYASILHAAWLSSNMWLGAMSVHLACILNSKCNIQINVTGSNIFKILTAVCWGIPCLLAGVCLALHKTKVITIGYGNNGVCWINVIKPWLIFYGAPVFLIHAVTMMSAVVVVRAIRKSFNFRKKGAVLRGKPYKQLILCVNLSLLMGFSWVFYFLAVGTDNTIVWTIHILVNGSQGLYVFLCFAARKSLLSAAITNIKSGTVWARKSNVSSDIIKLKMPPTTVTPFTSPCPSVKSLSISK